MTSATVSDELSRHIAEIISGYDDWTDDDKAKVLTQYMKIFGNVWKEAVTQFNTMGEDGPQELPAQQEKVAEPEITEEDLDDAEIRHEATLCAVIKKRKQFPARIAAIQGKTTRLHKHTIESLAVDLAPKPILEIDNYSQLDSSLDSLLSDCSSELSQSMSTLQPHNSRISNLAEALDILALNRNEPIEKILRGDD